MVCCTMANYLIQAVLLFTVDSCAVWCIGWAISEKRLLSFSGFFTQGLWDK